jgi:hypothetical protein
MRGATIRATAAAAATGILLALVVSACMDDGTAADDATTPTGPPETTTTAAAQVSTSAEPPGPPPLREARLAGSFTVRTRILAKSGYGTYVAPIFGWRFTPVCGNSACDVRWRDLHDRSIHGVLSRHGARYRGSYTGYFYMECSGAHVTSALRLRLRVVQARILGEGWRATRLVGSVRQREGAQLGCHGSEARLAVHARLKGDRD